MTMIPPGQCASIMPLETWLRPTAMKSKKRYRIGQGIKRCRSQQTSCPRLDHQALTQMVKVIKYQCSKGSGFFCTYNINISARMLYIVPLLRDCEHSYGP